MGVHLHDQDVDNVQDEHDECFVPVEHTVPGEPDKEGNWDAVHYDITSQGTPIQMEDLQRKVEEYVSQNGKPSSNCSSWCQVTKLQLTFPWSVLTLVLDQ